MKITERYVLNLILSILLIFSLIGTGSVLFAKNCLLDSDTYIENSEKNNISQNAYDEINEYFTNSEDYSRIPADVYMSAVTQDDVKHMIDAKIENMFSSITAGTKDREQVNFDFTALENSITDYFDKFAQENNVEVDDKYKAQLQKTIDTAKTEIEDFTDIYMLELVEKTGLIEKAEKIYSYLDYVLYGCIGLAVLCIIIMIAASIKRIANFFYWLAVSVMCTAVIGLIPAFYLKLSGVTDKFAIGNECVYTAYTGLMKSFIDTVMIAGIILLVDAVIFMIAGIIISKRNNKKKS